MADALMTGLVSARQGDEVLFTDAKNKFTDIGMFSPLCYLNFYQCYSTSGAGTLTYYYPGYSYTMYLGTNTTTGTIPTHTGLQVPIGTAPGTAPNTVNVTVLNGTSTGIWGITVTAIWNAGTVSGTVGEMGLYLRTTDKKDQGGWSIGNASYAGASSMWSRLCSADTDFQAFTIDNTRPLIIDWKILYSFG
jgi:hypothetical protein